MTKTTDERLEQLAVDTIRMLAVDAVEQARSGHPGMPMGMADAAFVLFHRILRHGPSRPDWPGRDRFVLSAGHGSMLLYALLHLYGYPVEIDDLKAFRQWGAKTPGHPERWCIPGVETTTGPLGQGIGNAVGLALASKMLGARLNTGDFFPADFRVFALASDGDMMEGVASEAASLAGHLGLGNLVVLYDDNHITIDGSTSLAFSEDVGRRFEAYGWQVLRADGHDRKALAEAFNRAVLESARPSLVCARTHIAYGSPNKQDTAGAHGAPLGPDEVRATKQAIGWPLDEPFGVPDDVRSLFARRSDGLKRERTEWEKAFRSWQDTHRDKAALWSRLFAPEIPEGLYATLAEAAGKDAGATRALSGKVLQRAAELLPGLVGGSADLAPSNKTTIQDSPAVAPGEFAGRNLHFGVREHAMGAVLNGMALTGGLIPYGGTFLVFSDYMRPAIRLAALMELGVIYVFTHDSIFVGEDGPTHQPIEHLAALRAIPGLTVYRPADALECAAGWTLAIQQRDRPTALVLTRQKVPYLDRPAKFDPDDLLRGACVVVEEQGACDRVVVATGSEVAPAAAAASQLGVRAVSMPSVELFLSQEESFRHAIVPPGARVAVVEASRDHGWHRLAGAEGLVVGIDRFGASAPAGEVAGHYGMTADAIHARLANWAT